MSTIFFRAFLVITALLGSLPAQAFVSASSDIIQIPAVAFAIRSGSVVDGDDNHGALTNAQGKYYAAVPFTQHGQRVCSFNLVHRDNDSDLSIIARLMKKKIVPNGNPFDPAVRMAQVNTGAGGTTAGVATKSDLTIAQPAINLRGAFYYVELEISGTLVELLGVQIEVHPTCN